MARRKQGTSAPAALHGLLVLDKPLGKTSMDMVRIVRRAAGGTKTGHAGTLDPLATGVLICCLGKGTRAVEGLMALTKRYEAELDLSAFTETDDAEGERREMPVAAPPDEQAVREVLRSLTGRIQQTPPAFSALKIGGRPAYQLARQGKAVSLAARTVRIDELRLRSYAWPRLRLAVTCGRGTYIRSLARQIGEALGTGGYLRALRRTQIGPYTLAQARSPEELPVPLTQAQLLPVPGGPTGPTGCA